MIEPRFPTDAPTHPVFELADVLDTGVLQGLLDDFHELVRIPTAIVDLKGRVLVGVGWQSICVHYHRVHPETSKHCRESDTQLSAGVAEGEFKLYKCKNQMWDVATPIMVDGHHVGNVFMGQFFFDDERVEREPFVAQARRYGFDEDRYLSALDDVPRLGAAAVNRAMAFLTRLAQVLSCLGHANLRLARSLAQREALTESLRESEETLRVTLSSIGDAVIAADASGRITFLNPQAAQLTGWSEEQALGEPIRTVFRVVDEHTGEPAEDVVGPVLREGKTLTLANHTSLVTRAQEVVPIEDSAAPIKDREGRVCGVVLVFHDVLEQRRAREALAAVSEQRRLALEAAELGAWDYRFTAGDVFWDERCRSMWGIAEGDQIDYLAAIDSIHADDRAGVDEAVQRAIAGENDGSYHREFRVVWPDGSVHWIASHGRVHFEDVGDQRRAIRMVGANLDVTQEKQAETERERLLDEVRQTAEELARSNQDLEQFAYVASHDLQEPLRLIGGHIELLDEECGEQFTPEARKLVNSALDGVGRLYRLIQDLLAYSRAGNVGTQPQCTDMQAVLDEVLALHQPAVRESGAVVSHDSMPSIWADPTQMTQVLSNLIGNSLKFRSPQRSPVIHVGVERRNAEWLFSVRDNGIGIPARFRERIFKIFQRLYHYEQYPGSGIGLAICKKIVERHGGRMAVEASDGAEGTTFSFTIPVSSGMPR